MVFCICLSLLCGVLHLFVSIVWCCAFVCLYCVVFCICLSLLTACFFSLPESKGVTEASAQSSTLGEEDPSTADADVPVDESLFAGEDLTEDVECEGSGGGGVCENGGGGSVAVDESLFDIDNLQDLDLNDPAILQLPTS